MTTSCMASYMNARAHAHAQQTTVRSQTAATTPPIVRLFRRHHHPSDNLQKPSSRHGFSVPSSPCPSLSSHHPHSPITTLCSIRSVRPSLSPTPPSLSLSLLHSHTLRFTYQCLAFGFSNFPSIQQHSSSLSTHPLTHPGKPHPYFTRVLLRIPSVVNCVSAYLSQRERTRESM